MRSFYFPKGGPSPNRTNKTQFFTAEELLVGGIPVSPAGFAEGQEVTQLLVAIWSSQGCQRKEPAWRK